MIRVLTLNLWGRRGRWDERRSLLRDGLRELAPDLVAFQEAVRTSEYDQVVDLLGSEFHVAHQAERDLDGVGVAIASRWPVTNVADVDLHATPRTTAAYTSTTLMAEVQVPDPIGSLLFANNNPSWQLERERQALATARAIEALVAGRDVHVVLAGDFDDVPESASIRFWRGLQSLDGMSVAYRDAWEPRHPGEPGYTFASRNPLRSLAWDIDRRIDYVFVRCDTKGPTLEIAGSALAFAEPQDGVWASDHFGVTADLGPRRPFPDE